MPEEYEVAGSSRGSVDNSLETKMSAIWAELLGVDVVRPEDNFFELGGNSLLAGEVVTRLQATSGIELPLRFLFETETLRELVRLIGDQTPTQ